MLRIPGYCFAVSRRRLAAQTRGERATAGKTTAIKGQWPLRATQAHSDAAAAASCPHLQCVAQPCAQVACQQT
eukprot:9169337-Alexandrium_andersonii.AAC.1